MCKKFKEQSGTTQSTLNTEGKPEAARKTEVARKNQRRNRKQGPICAGKETDAALCSNGGACGNNKEKTQKNYSFEIKLWDGILNLLVNQIQLNLGYDSVKLVKLLIVMLQCLTINW
ncbi:hypothetical protein HKD37_15G043150 [Glycine soja]